MSVVHVGLPPRSVRRCAAVAVGAITALALGGLNASAEGAGPAGVAPAPASGASAGVIDLEYLDSCVSCTTAEAGTQRPHGRSAAIRLLGREASGGESVANASQKGALLALPVNPLLNLAIAGWSTVSSVDAGRSTSSSHSRAALVDVAVLGERPADSMLTVALLESTSDATYTRARSQGEASNNGLDVTALHGALALTVLHSQTSGDPAGSWSILAIDGNPFVTSGQTPSGGGIPIIIPGVLTLTLLQAGARGSSMVIGTVALPGVSRETAGVLTAH